MEGDNVRVSFVFQISVVQAKKVVVRTKNIVDLFRGTSFHFENLVNEFFEIRTARQIETLISVMEVNSFCTLRRHISKIVKLV